MAHMRMFRIRNTFIIVIMAHLLSIENQGYTSSASKSRLLAKYWISGDIKWSAKKKSYTKHRVFTAKCTPKGVCSFSLTKS